jgi:dephospho-CoA kinase
VEIILNKPLKLIYINNYSKGGEKMNLVIILGPPAVGKMTVGQALADLTGLKLLHNHMISELIRQFVPVYGSGSAEGKRLKNLFTQEICEAVAKSDLPGLIFTNMFNFDSQTAHAYIQALLDLYESHGAKTCVVELCADEEVRIERNRTDNRLLHKPSKRDLVLSENLRRESESQSRLNSHDGEQPFANYLRINNTCLTPEAVAVMIKETFF